MILWALANTGACSWNWMQEAALNDAEKAVMAFNISQDVTAGYTVSFLSVTERT